MRAKPAAIGLLAFAGVMTDVHAATRLGSTDVALLAELASDYAADGDGVVAVRYRAAAYALAPMNPVVVAACAGALDAAGRKEDARWMRVKLKRLR